MRYVVRGFTAQGNEVFYADPASGSFTSSSVEEAFSYSTVEAARERVLNLNLGTPQHGIRFLALVVD